MSIHRLDGNHFHQMIQESAHYFSQYVASINALNVFPVPDGDTGTNMNLTWQSAVQQLQGKSNEHIGHIGSIVSRGLLIGARGNSGVILSQLFRGFCKYIENRESISIIDMAAGMQFGVEMAYRVIQRPTEGTILTVAREAAKYAVTHANEFYDFESFFEAVINKSNEVLDQTPDMLPILKKAGVVDAGGKGLVTLYEGMLASLKGTIDVLHLSNTNSMDPSIHDHAQLHF